MAYYRAVPRNRGVGGANSGNGADIADEIAWRELRRDPMFPWLSEARQRETIAGAIAIGREQAARFSGRPVRSVAAELGACVAIPDSYGQAKPSPYDVMDWSVAGVPTFAEYDSATRLIIVYRSGIGAVARMLEGGTEDAALDLLIAHELFHHLEATRIGLVQDKLPPVFVPMFWGLFRARRRVRSTGEIAAHAFAHALIGVPLVSA